MQRACLVNFEKRLFSIIPESIGMLGLRNLCVTPACLNPFNFPQWAVIFIGKPFEPQKKAAEFTIQTQWSV